jgi:hypothetical protein
LFSTKKEKNNDAVEDVEYEEITNKSLIFTPVLLVKNKVIKEKSKLK